MLMGEKEGVGENCKNLKGFLEKDLELTIFPWESVSDCTVYTRLDI